MNGNRKLGHGTAAANNRAIFKRPQMWVLEQELSVIMNIYMCQFRLFLGYARDKSSGIRRTFS